MLVTWKPMPVWLYPPRPGQVDRFKSALSRTLDDLERELAAVDATDVVIGGYSDRDFADIQAFVDASAVAARAAR